MNIKKFYKHPLEKFAGKLKESKPFLDAMKDRNIKNHNTLMKKPAKYLQRIKHN